MPETYQSLTAINAALREVLKYDPVKSQTSEKSAMLWKNWGKGDSSKINNRSARIVLDVDDAAPIKADSTEFADYPTPGNQVQVVTTIPITTTRKTFSVSGAVKRQNATGTALLDVIVAGTRNVEKMFDKQMNFAAHGDATGEIGRVSGVSSLTVTCAHASNLFGTRRIFKNEVVEFRATNGTLHQAGARYSKVTSVDRSAKTFITDAIASDATTNDIIYDYGSYNNWFRGLDYHVNNTGAWQGLSDRTAYQGTSSVLVSASSANLSRALFDLLIGEMKYKIGDDDQMGDMMAYMSPAQIAQFKSLGYDLVRYDGRLKSLNTGFSSDALQHGDLMVKGSVDCRHDRVYVGDILGLAERFQTIDPQWVPNDAGDYMHQANAASGQGKADGYFCYYEWEGNFGVWQPRKVGAITTLATAGLPLGHTN